MFKLTNGGPFAISNIWKEAQNFQNNRNLPCGVVRDVVGIRKTCQMGKPKSNYYSSKQTENEGIPRCFWQGANGLLNQTFHKYISKAHYITLTLMTHTRLLRFLITSFQSRHLHRERVGSYRQLITQNQSLQWRSRHYQMFFFWFVSRHDIFAN